MTGRTHDLTAFTALSIVTIAVSPHNITLATAITGFIACFIGGLAPDADQPTADLWRRLPAGNVIGRIFTPFMGGHRSISHSLFGITLFGAISWILLRIASGILLVDMDIVWLCFMIGFISHLAIDLLTKEGVPVFFPLPWKFGIPPIRAMRMQTGEFIEKSVLFPGLLFFNVYLYTQHYNIFLKLLKSLR